MARTILQIGCCLIVYLFLISGLSAQNLLLMPESVAFDSLRNRYLISNYGHENIVQIDTGGTQSLYYDLTDWGAPYGNCIYGDTFFVSVGTAILGIDLAIDSVIMDVTMPVAERSYDGLTTDTSGNLYVVYTGSKIYKIRLSDQTTSVFVGSGLAPWMQDIIFDARNNRLLVVGYSSGAPIQAVSLADSSVTTLVNTPMGYFDGITIDHAGNVYVASHAGDGAVYRYNRFFTNPPELIVSAMNQPAGLDYNWRDNVLAIPSFAGRFVAFVPLTFTPDLDSHAFSDAAGGDGDGVLEAGESVDLVVSVVNYRSTAVTDLEITLSIDDASITIDDGFCSIGTVASLDTADNGDDPFTFTIPGDYVARLDSLCLELSYTGGTEIDTFSLMVALGAPRLLFVDDDDHDNIEPYFTECLAAAHIPWDIRTAPPCPTAGDLSGYDLVIWLTGDYRLPLDADEIAAMKGYLDGGGNLFLTGQGIAYLLDIIDQDFLHTYLRAEYLSAGLVQILAAAPGGQVFSAGDSVMISGSGGAGNQTDPDHLAAVNGGVGEFTYVGSTDLGAVSYSGDYRLLFFGFGFEGIVNGSSRWADRYAIMDKVLEFFDFQRPGPPPEILTVTVSPGAAMHLTDHEPEFGWSYTDNGGMPQMAFWIQVGEDGDWSSAEMWDSGPVASSASSAVYAGSGLQDGRSYYFRVRASNGALWSEWYAGQMRMNSVPVPTGLNPDDLQELVVDSVVLVHDNLSDAEGDTITYGYQIYDDQAMTILVAEAFNQPAGDGATTTWEPTHLLAANDDYYWRVCADDGYEKGLWSTLASFKVIPSYVCGDANGDGLANVADAVFIINYVFKSGPPPDPVASGDANCDGQANVGDAVFLITFVFKAGPAPCCP